MQLRRFTEAGIEQFREMLQDLRKHPDHEPGRDLLEHPKYTQVVSPPIRVAEEQFRTKGDAALYLHSVLAPLDEHAVADDAGLWTWLSLWFFDSVCRHQQGGWSVKNDYCYVFEPRNSRNVYRHHLFISWQILRVAPVHNRMFLSVTMHVLPGVIGNVFNRLYLTRIPAIFEVLHRLYWDEKTRRPRSGMIGSRIVAGDLRHRLPLRIRQLEKNYDLMSLDADQLIRLLGPEFSFARHSSRDLFEDQLDD